MHLPTKIAPFLACCLLSTACGDKDDSATPVLDADGDGFSEELDCDDDDPGVYPGADETCDGLDNDCDGELDEGAGGLWYPDDDDDGWGALTGWTEACEQPTGFVAETGDCDDDDDETAPEAAERCDGVDNDCDGSVDEELTEIWYADADSDGYGNPDFSLDACDPGSGWVADSRDCDDGDPAVHPDAEELCNGVDDDCDDAVDEELAQTWYADADADGYGDPDSSTEACDPGSGWVADSRDCDDGDPAVHPDAEELCNGIDDDCDDATDEDDAADAGTWYADDDDDGYGDPSTSAAACSQPSGTVANASDCDDADPAVHPAAEEQCNGIDDDCDGTTDEDDAIDASTWYADADADGYGDASAANTACDQPSGHSTDDSDCDDADPAVHPAADELCNGVDDDCDGETDETDASDAGTWHRDADADGYGDSGSALTACTQPSGYLAAASETDCDDHDDDIHPAADELCDGEDNDCDGTVDEDDAVDASTWYADADADGYGDPGTSAAACSQPSSHVANADDCDDGEALAWTGAEERCDGADNDCDGTVDEDDAVDASTWYADADADGYGDPSSSTTACAQPSGHSAASTDCDDDDPAVNPGAAEACNGMDDDCDGEIDEGWVAEAETWYADADGDGYGDPDSSTSACSLPSGYVADDSDCDDGDASVYYEDYSGACTLGCDRWVPGDYLSIQDAIDVSASSTTICVSAGTYTETIDTDGKAIYLYGPDGAGSTTIDGDGAGTVVTIDDGEGADTVLHGLTITNGEASHSLYHRLVGGGIYVWDSAPTLAELVITGNFAENGGGMYLASGGDVYLYDVTLEGNSADYQGGGLNVNWCGSLVASGLVVLDNVAGVDGGGLYLGSSSGSFSATELELSGNSARDCGGGLHFEGEEATIEGLTASDNSAAQGGAIYMIDSSYHAPLVTITQAALDDNLATESGGAIYLAHWAQSYQTTQLVMSNARLAGNAAASGGGAIYGFYGDQDLTNVVMLDNGAPEGGAIYLYAATVSWIGGVAAGNSDGALGLLGGTTDIHNVVFAGNPGSTNAAIEVDYATPTISSVVVHDNTPGHYGGMLDPSGSDGNLSTDPLFLDSSSADPRDWDLHLDSSSPLIDAGSSSAGSDPDGSASDIGAYGGPWAGSWDLDGDGYYAWWQPGAYDSSTYAALGWDCDDQDPAVHADSGC